jgi:tetratricopeptide (TPR) repeat protein
MAARWFGRLTLLLVFTACVGNAHKMKLERGYRDLEAERIDDAITNFTAVFDKSSDKELVFESAKNLADIYYRKKKDYKTALRFLEVIIANSDNFPASLEALKQKALIQHKDLSLFEEAIITYSRILSHPDLKEGEQNELRLNLAKCYYAINKFDQARNELTPLLDPKQTKEMRMEAQKLEASISQAEGNFEKAINAYNQILALAETDQQKRDALMNLSLCYEQKEDYKGALEALKRISKKDELLDSKIKQLERLSIFQGRRLRK